MKNNINLILIFVLLFLFITPFYVYAETYSTKKYDESRITEPIGPLLDKYIEEGTKYVSKGYVGSFLSTPVGVLVKFYYYTPPSNPLFRFKGHIETINRVLFYNPSLIGDFDVDFYTREYSKMYLRDSPTKYLKAGHKNACNVSHTINYETITHWTWTYTAPSIKKGSDDLKFKVDRIETVDSHTFDTKENCEDFINTVLL